jgi:ribose transport system permease protein
MNAAKRVQKPARRVGRFSEAGLVLIVGILGVVLYFCGGSVEVRKMERGPDADPRAVFTTAPDGRQVPVMEKRNKFLNSHTLTQIAKDTSFIAIMAVGMTFVIITGYIDLSVGAIYALASVLGGIVLRAYGPAGSYSGVEALGVILGSLTCLVVGGLCGLANGGMFVLLKVHPFIITLGTMTIFRGLAFVITTGQSVADFPASFRRIALWEPIPGLSLVPLFVTLVVTVLGSVCLTRMAAGRRVFAVGGNELAARYSGVRVERVKLGVYIIAGITAGLAALLAIGYYGAGSSGDGQGYELKVIAASVVGGTSLSGGRGSALGAALGALIIQMIDSGIVILGINQNYSQVIIGAVVIVAVLLDRLNNWLTQRRLTQAKTIPGF